VEVGYAFSFADTPAGQYVLLAGSDYDDNGIIDDDGEMFGGYPLSADPQRVDVSSDLSGLDFAVQHLFNLRPSSMGTAFGARHRIRRLW
jgi:serine protease